MLDVEAQGLKTTLTVAGVTRGKASVRRDRWRQSECGFSVRVCL